MSLQTLLSIVAASIGFVSGLWLCYGAVFITAKKIVKSDDNSWDASPDIASSLITQSAEYLAGGVLLVLTFVIQIAAAIAPTNNLQTVCQLLLNPCYLIPLTVAASFLVSIPIYLLRKKYLARQVNTLKNNV